MLQCRFAQSCMTKLQLKLENSVLLTLFGLKSERRLSEFTLSFFLLQGFRLKILHCDYLQPLFKIRDFGCKYVHGLKNLKVSNIEKLKVEREARRRKFSTSSKRPSVIVLTVLLKKTQMTAHCYVPPFSAVPLFHLFLLVLDILYVPLPLVSTEGIA